MVRNILTTLFRSTVPAAIVCGTLLSVPGVNAKTVYVSTNGSPGNNGTGFSSGYDFRTALGKVSAGDTILVQGGTHTIARRENTANTITISCAGSSSKLIHIIAESGKRATFDFQWPDNSKYLDPNSKVTSYGFWFEASAKYLYFERIGITRAGYQGIYVTGSNITFENCLFFDNWNSGVEVNKGGSHVTLSNCDSYGNYDSKYKNGGMADGFAVKQDIGPGNRMIGCRAWNNSDDGYDTYGEDGDPILFERCWAFNNGYDEGNCNGFKVGGNNAAQRNIVKNCISFGHKKKGFDQNHNMGGVTFYNCIAYKNESYNFAFGEKPGSGDKHTFKNNISLDGNVDVQNATESNNTWNSGFSVSSSDFESLDLSLADSERNIDGTIPETDLFRLKSTSDLVDAGVDVDIPFFGGSPDIGAFEYNPTTGSAANYINVKSAFNVSQQLRDSRPVIFLDGVADDARVTVYMLNGIRVPVVTARNGSRCTVDCSTIASGRYITALYADGVKRRILFTK